MITILQIVFVAFALALLIIIIIRPFHTKKEITHLPENYREILHHYVKFYNELDESGQKYFEERVEKFLSGVKLTGVNAVVEDLDVVLIGAAAIIPVFFIKDWQYVNLHEVLLYPGNFNQDFDQHGSNRFITGMVGTGALQNEMIISKWELRQGFINEQTASNTAIHEFAHLIDKMDGSFDGVPEILLERKYIPQWQQLVYLEMERIKKSQSDIDVYAATNPVEFFAVVCEYFFKHPQLFRENHNELNQMLERIFFRK